MGTQYRRGQRGYTIIEVMLFFAVTGALMLGVMGSASFGVNTQRYNDAVNTFTAIIQQEFTNATNVTNTKSIESMCGPGGADETPRGISNCVIIGRLVTVDTEGSIVAMNIVGSDPGAEDETDTELEVIQSYTPKVDIQTQETDKMSWETKLERGDPLAASAASILILRSPRSGNVYSYVIHSSSDIITNDTQLRDRIGELITASPSPNSVNQYLCIDRSGWVVTPARAVRLAPFASGPSGVANVEVQGSICAS
jgi:type II secretory pathway pseudopilin PulG